MVYKWRYVFYIIFATKINKYPQSIIWANFINIIVILYSYKLHERQKYRTKIEGDFKELKTKEWER